MLNSIIFGVINFKRNTTVILTKESNQRAVESELPNTGGTWFLTPNYKLGDTKSSFRFLQSPGESDMVFGVKNLEIIKLAVSSVRICRTSMPFLLSRIRTQVRRVQIFLSVESWLAYWNLRRAVCKGSSLKAQSGFQQSVNEKLYRLQISNGNSIIFPKDYWLNLWLSHLYWIKVEVIQWATGPLVSVDLNKNIKDFFPKKPVSTSRLNCRW